MLRSLLRSLQYYLALQIGAGRVYVNEMACILYACIHEQRHAVAFDIRWQKTKEVGAKEKGVFQNSNLFLCLRSTNPSAPWQWAAMVALKLRPSNANFGRFNSYMANNSNHDILNETVIAECDLDDREINFVTRSIARKHLRYAVCSLFLGVLWCVLLLYVTFDRGLRA